MHFFEHGERAAAAACGDINVCSTFAVASRRGAPQVAGVSRCCFDGLRKYQILRKDSREKQLSATCLTW